MKTLRLTALIGHLFGAVFFASVIAASGAGEEGLRKAVKEITAIPYNPTSKLFTPVDFDAMYSDFTSTFERVSFCAPGNGKTYSGDNSLLGQCEDPDVKLVGYLYLQNVSNRPGIVITHGGGGPTRNMRTEEVYWPNVPISVAGSYGSLVGMALALKNNGYHVLAMDRRSGFLSACSKTKAYTSGHSCSYLSGYIRQDIPEDFVPLTRYGDRNALSHADVMAGATFLESSIGQEVPLGGLGGSRGGAAMIATAARQHTWSMDESLTARIEAFFAPSPYPSENYTALFNGDNRFCRQVMSAAAYSEAFVDSHIIAPVPGSGIGTISRNDLSGMNDFYRLTEFVDALEDIIDPMLILNSLNDNDVTPEQGFAFHLKSQNVDNVETLTLAQGGHNNLIWRSDPYFMNRTILAYFKNTIGAEYSDVTTLPGFSNLGPNQNNPYWVKLPRNMPGLDSLLYTKPVEEFQDIIINNCFPAE